MQKAGLQQPVVGQHPLLVSLRPTYLGQRPCNRARSSVLARVQPVVRLGAVRSRRCSIVVRAAAANAGQADNFQNPFVSPREMGGLQGALGNVPGSLTYVVALLLVGAGASAGFAAGARAPANARTVAQVAGALVGAAGAAYASLQLKSKREEAAVLDLYNTIVAKGDPRALTRDDVAALEARYGITIAKAMPEEVKPIYGAFVEASIPPGDEPLTGYEGASIASFKDALGLDDADAASVHIDVGRRLLRSRAETTGRSGGIEQRKTFQKLIYVSTSVFGDQKAAFLLPWKRVFELSDSQIYVAKRDNAKALLEGYLQRAGDFQASKPFLMELAARIRDVRLSEDVAVEVVQEAARAKVEASVTRAIDCVKQRARTKDYTVVMQEATALIEFNRSLGLLSGDPDVAGLGVRKVALAGGKYEEAATRASLKEIFRVFLEQRITVEKGFSDGLEVEVAELRGVLGLSSKEADAVRSEVVSKEYRALLRDEVKSGRLEAAPSQAAVLEALCRRMHYPPEQAAALHSGLYRNKLEQLLEKKKLTEEDSSELMRLRKLLCIGKAEMTALHKELCGKIYREAVEAAVSTGVEGFDTDERNKVKQVQADVMLDDASALEVVSAVSRKAFMGFITRSRGGRDRLESAKELKKLVFFSNIVVSPLVEDLTPKEDAAAADKKEAAMKELADIMAKAKAEVDAEDAAKKAAEGVEEGAEAAAAAKEGAEAEGPVEAEVVAAEVAASEVAAGEEGPVVEVVGEKDAEPQVAEGEAVKPTSLAKAEAAADARKAGEKVGEVTMKSQKVVTVRDDVELRERTDIYRNFLLYCMSGDVVTLPMGSQVVVERDEAEFARLSQLGDILGLTPFDVAGVHQGLAEQAFRNQAQALVGDGNLTKEKAESLQKMREQMGLPKEAADKIIKGVQNQRLIGSLQTAKATGALTLDKLMEMKEAGVEIESFVGEELRAQMFTQELTKALSAGTGELDEEKLLKRLPADLGIDEKKVQRIASELAKDKRRTTLVQAVSNLRQRNAAGAVATLNNLVVAYKLVPGDSEPWSDKTEVADLFSLYCAKEASPDKRAAVAGVLGLSEAEAATLSEGSSFRMESEMEEEAIF